MDDKKSSGKVIMNKEQLHLFEENKREEEHRLAIKNAIAAMVDRKEMVSKASGKVIIHKDQQPMLNVVALKNAISACVRASKDRATKKLVEQDSAAGDGTTPSI